MEKALRWLKQTLNYEFSNTGLFVQALTHRSAPGDSNERLEFLGDAVLDFVVSDCVFRAQPLSDEGDLSRLRAALVKDTTLAEIAMAIDLGEHLILGSGEKKTGGHRRESILADALEALFGAVFVDRGFDAARQIIEETYGKRLRELPDPEELRDPKTRLQELLQARQVALPEYEVIEVSGKAHAQQFRVRCAVDGLDVASVGTGSSRRGAEQQAAARVLDAIANRQQ